VTSSAARYTLLATILGSSMVFIDLTVVNVALPAIQQDLGGGLAAQQWVVDAYLLTLGSLILVGGSLADIFGEIRTFLAGVVSFGLASALCAAAPTTNLLIAFRGLQRFRGDARLSTWLYRICVNVALGKIRTRKRRPAAIGVADLDTTSADPSLTERPETPDRTLERRQEQERVYKALEQLAPKKRIVLYLHEIEGLDLKEIAYLVDSNPVTVRTRLFYARREFYRILAGEPAGDAGEAAEPEPLVDAGGGEP